MLSVDAERSIIKVGVDLTTYAGQLGKDIDLWVQAFTQDVFNQVQSGGARAEFPGTPIDTGFARANWQGGIGGVTPAPAISAEAAKADPGAGRAAAARRQADNAELVRSQMKAGLTIELANNAPYIAALEDGWSQQAPEGMVKVVVLNAQSLASENAEFLIGRRTTA